MVTTMNDDLFVPDVIRDPYTYFARLREEDPIHWNGKHGTWIVTRYDDVLWLVRHPELFSNRVPQREQYPPIDESDLDLQQIVNRFFFDFLVYQDPPKHTEMRKQVHAYLTPKAMERLRPSIQSIIEDLLDKAEAKGRMDLQQDFAMALPLLVIAHLMGLPNQDRKFIQEQLAPKLLYMSRGEGNRMQMLCQGIRELRAYFAPIVAERVANPGEDLLSVLARGEKSGAYTRDQVVANAILLLVAGYNTTGDLICNGTLAFLRHPEQWEAFKRDPTQASRLAIEECLRYDSPQKTVTRMATDDIQMRDGKVIRKLDRVRWVIASANRDPEQFPEPNAFDIKRNPNAHLSFGAGIHYCVGATLTRVESAEAFKALAVRFPNLRLEEEQPKYQPSVSFRTINGMPVAWK